MARTSHKLTDPKVRAAKPRKTAYKLFDGQGLYLLVTPAGQKYWRLKYRFAGKEKTLALGVYDDVSLADARDGRKAARALLREKRDPLLARKHENRLRELQARHTFEAIAREWYDVQEHTWTEKHADQVITSLEQNIFPALGARPIVEISAPELLDVLKVIERRGTLEVSARVLQRCGAVFRYAIATSRATDNPAADLKGALKSPKKRHYPALDAKELPLFLKCLDKFPGHKSTELATRMLLLTFVRTGELIGALWEELDLEERLWRIPEERMKMRIPHIVPLSDQVIAILEELRPITGWSKFLFPGQKDAFKPMSNMTILRGLKRLGYQGRTTGHGFRTTASTVLNEMGFSPDAIERQLAHGGKGVRAVYNKAQYLDERRKIMQAWADYLDGVKDGGAKVVPIRKKQA